MSKDLDLKIIEERFNPELLEEVKSKKNGGWVKYFRYCGDNLFEDLNGKNTGWYVEKSLSDAHNAIADGDVFVYYEETENGFEPKIKLGFICTQLFDVRGTDIYQSLPKEYLKIAFDKIDELKMINKSKKKCILCFESAKEVAKDYFKLAYLSKNLDTQVPATLLSNLYYEAYSGFSYSAPYKSTRKEDLSPIYEDIFSKRNRELDEQVFNPRPNKIMALKLK